MCWIRTENWWYAAPSSIIAHKMKTERRTFARPLQWPIFHLVQCEKLLTWKSLILFIAWNAQRGSCVNEMRFQWKWIESNMGAINGVHVHTWNCGMHLVGNTYVYVVTSCRNIAMINVLHTCVCESVCVCFQPINIHDNTGCSVIACQSLCHWFVGLHFIRRMRPAICGREINMRSRNTL